MIGGARIASVFVFFNGWAGRQEVVGCIGEMRGWIERLKNGEAWFF